MGDHCKYVSRDSLYLGAEVYLLCLNAIAIQCLCFALAKLKTERKLSVTAGSTNTAVTDRTIRL